MKEFDAVTRYKDNPEISTVRVIASSEAEARRDLEGRGYTVSRIIQQSKNNPHTLSPGT